MSCITDLLILVNLTPSHSEFNLHNAQYALANTNDTSAASILITLYTHIYGVAELLSINNVPLDIYPIT